MSAPNPVDDRPHRPIPISRRELTRVARLWRHDASPGRVLGAWENFVFDITAGAEAAVLRLVETSRRSAGELAAELEFVMHLRKSGVLVPEVLAFGDGRRIAPVELPVDSFFACLFGRVEGRRLSGGELLSDPTGVRRWGARIATLHAAAEDFVPVEGSRPSWHQNELLTDSSGSQILGAAAFAALEEVVRDLSVAAPGAGDYGLIHADLHGRNVIARGGAVTVIDFDDLCYHWYAYDVAVAWNWLCDSGGEPGWCAEELLAGYSDRRALAPAGAARLGRLAYLRSCLDLIFVEGRRRAGMRSPLLKRQVDLIRARVARQLSTLH